MSDAAPDPADQSAMPKSRRFRPSLPFVLILILLVGCGLTAAVMHFIVYPRQAIRIKALQNVRRAGVAAMNFTSSMEGQLPSQASRTDAGEPLLSWRVALLPLLDNAALYREADQTQPWNSEANQILRENCPPVLQVPGSPAEGTLQTSYFAIVGEDTPFPEHRVVTLDEISQADGQGNTLMYVEATGMNIEWAEPNDIPFAALDASPRELRGKGPSTHRSSYGPAVIFCDGHARFLNNDIDPAVLRALATYRGKEELSEKY